MPRSAKTTGYTPLKEGYDDPYLERLAKLLAPQVDGFRKSDFLKRIRAADWEQLELKARMLRIAQALDETLSPDFPQALRELDPVAPEFEGYLALFIPEFVTLRASADFDRHWSHGVEALAQYTVYSSAELAVRPFLLAQPERMLRQMLEWTKHENEHVRRLASEGCRPRLPWATALPFLKADPTALLPILEALALDSSEYVRRSVANNWNDVSKDHPELVRTQLTRWLEEHPDNHDTRRLVKHAARTLLKQGDAACLALFGFSPPDAMKVCDFTLHPEEAALPEALEFRFRLQSDRALGRVRLEYAVHYPKANGELRPKKFQLSEFESAENSRTLERRHAFEDLSTRKHYPGPHVLALFVNGVELARASFSRSAAQNPSS